LTYQNSEHVEGFYVQSWSLKGMCVNCTLD
jgi:hypothetical protein